MKQLSFLFLLLLLVACTEEPENDVVDFEWTKENSTNLSRVIAEQEEIDIQLYLEMRREWKVNRTGSGLRYYIYEHGSVDTSYHPKAEDVAEIEYVISMLDGTECYKTEDDEYEEFVVDNSEIESGIQEGIKKLSIGDRAKLIIPSHIGHGITGDMNKIPPRTVLVVDIHLMGIIRR